MRKIAIPLSVASLALLFACGGKSTSSSSGNANGNDAGGGPTDSNSDVVGTLIAACPSTAPTFGAACSPIGQLCEYGDEQNAECNVIAHCSPNGQWENAALGGCPSSAPQCAASVADGTSCSADPSCATANGLCSCVDLTMGPGRADGGPDTYAWSCPQPIAGCPTWPERPRIGSACSKPDLRCDYAPCHVGEGFAFSCSSEGYWQDSFSSSCSGG